MESQNAVSASISNERSAVRSVNPWLIAATVTIAAFMELLDTSIANVALPNIGGGLGRSFDEVS
jgi:MFS transporter, DHA2 family, multidrug resistance protein